MGAAPGVTPGAAYGGDKASLEAEKARLEARLDETYDMESIKRLAEVEEQLKAMGGGAANAERDAKAAWLAKRDADLRR